MLGKFFTNLIDLNQKELDRIEKTVEKINSLESKAKKFKKEDFVKKTEEFKKRIVNGEKLQDILPEAYASVREVSKRVLGMRPYDVQLAAAVALFEGKVAEQKTGEGKTLSAVLPLYLHALMGRGAHLVTVNDYLARRDAGWNAPVFRALGLSVGVIAQEQKSYIYDEEYSDKSHGDERLEHLKPVERKFAYEADVTYGTNNEFGFDYLRDNMVGKLSEMVQRGPSSTSPGGHYFAIVDEVDSVLIDEARTPLIISAPDMEPTDKYYKFSELITKLNPDTDYTVDEKIKSASLTEHGITRVEKIMGVDNLYEKDFESIHHIENALRAKTLFLVDRDYVVREGEVIIVDEFTGRLMVGRRWGDGLHQAVEAREGVKIKQESKTLATISFQNYFRMYEVLSGMTGTASTEAEEFKKIYNLDVVVVPTNRPMIRNDGDDAIYKNLRAKYSAIISEIEEKNKKGQPVLVGTTSIEKNEIISQFLKRKKIVHNVLNAKNHEREAVVIADAGNLGAVTVATNMAGRGVDIVLGGSQPEVPPGIEIDDYKKTKDFAKWQKMHDKVIKAGGLHVIGTERHESRRIDNQLRGRSGRQGDPGSTQFFLSLEDDLMRIFGGEQIKSLMTRLKVPDDQPIENKLINRAIEQAQVKVEGHNFDIRKNLVEYDDVANQQREIIYSLRKRILESKDLKTEVKEKLARQVDKVMLASQTNPEGGNFDSEKIVVGLLEMIPFDDVSRGGIKTQIQKAGSKEKIEILLTKILDDVYGKREKDLTPEIFREVEKYAYLGSIDHLWIDHIDRIDELRSAVGLRGVGQRNPLVEFKNEAYEMFDSLLERIDEELSRRIFRVGVARAQRPEIPLESARTNIDTRDNTGLTGPSAISGQTSVGKESESRQLKSEGHKIGRNDPCWCGSGKKWKKCHYPQER